MQVAIEQALTVLGWYENLQSDEIPPEHLWEDSEGLEMWWKTIEEKRKTGESISRDDGDADDSEQGSGMAENEYARALKQG